MSEAVAAQRRSVLRTLHETAVRSRIGWRGMLVLSAFWFAIAYVMQPLSSTIIPLLVTNFTHPAVIHLGSLAFHVDINTYIAGLDTVGAAFALVWQPAIGALSDRTRATIGRRRPYIGIGVVGDVIFLTVIAFVTTYWGLLLAYAFFQMASNTAQGPYQGMLPDQVPEEQRSEASGYYGLMNMVGTIFGFVIVGAILIPTGHLRLAILTLPLVIAVCGALVFFGVPDRRITRTLEHSALRSLLFSFAIDVKRYRDFAWLMVSRLFFLMAPVGVETFAFNFIRYTFHYDQKQASFFSSILLAMVVVFAAVMSMAAGFIAQRVGKKRMVAAACVIGAVGAVLEIFAPTLLLVLVFGIILGISLGVFLSVDWAFMTDLIPKAEAGRYMGLSNIATVSAGLIARPLLGPIIDAFNNGRTSTVGYRVMFGAVTIFYLVALVTLRPVREIKVE